MNFFAWLESLFVHKTVATVTTIVPKAATPQAPVTPVTSFKLTWEVGHPERGPWTIYLANEIQSNLATFCKAADITTFRPDWASLTDPQRVQCLAQMFCSIAEAESSWDPTCASEDVGTSDKNTWSIGLFSVSVCDWQNTWKYDYDQLLTSLPNIQVAVNIIVQQIITYGKIIMNDNENKYFATLCYGDKYDQSAQIIADVQAVKF